MGNCLKLRPARTWVDDEEWDFADDSESMKQNHCKENKKKKGERTTVMTEEKREEASCNRVKIKLTKKQLQELSELLHEMHGLQIEEALAKFIQKNSVISKEFGSQTGPWRPVLQGIPEE